MVVTSWTVRLSGVPVVDLGVVTNVTTFSLTSVKHLPMMVIPSQRACQHKGDIVPLRYGLTRKTTEDRYYRLTGEEYSSRDRAQARANHLATTAKNGDLFGVMEFTEHRGSVPF